MLSKEEELKLTTFLEVADKPLKKDILYSTEFYVKAVRWLAEKLKETNDELKTTKEQVDELKAECEELKLKYDQLNGTA
jgi:tRNA(Phe) wybutosine-synthesizing methylase Tyw3